MDANSEVMQPVATSAPRPAQPETRRAVDPGPKQGEGRRPGEQRLSEDPMRRTDRYRLVMPYSTRV
jgi:hypothetical protein